MPHFIDGMAFPGSQQAQAQAQAQAYAQAHAHAHAHAQMQAQTTLGFGIYPRLYSVMHVADVRSPYPPPPHGYGMYHAAAHPAPQPQYFAAGPPSAVVVHHAAPRHLGPTAAARPQATAWGSGLRRHRNNSSLKQPKLPRAPIGVEPRPVARTGPEEPLPLHTSSRTGSRSGRPTDCKKGRDTKGEQRLLAQAVLLLQAVGASPLASCNDDDARPPAGNPDARTPACPPAHAAGRRRGRGAAPGTHALTRSAMSLRAPSSSRVQRSAAARTMPAAAQVDSTRLQTIQRVDRALSGEQPWPPRKANSANKARGAAVPEVPPAMHTESSGKHSSKKRRVHKKAPVAVCTDIAHGASGGSGGGGGGGPTLSLVLETTLATTIAGAFVRSGQSLVRSDPVAVTVDMQTGAIYVADFANSAIRRLAPNGDHPDAVVGGDALWRGTVHVRQPVGIAADHRGNVIVVSADDTIHRIASNGTATLFAGGGGRGHKDGRRLSATFNTPSGVTVDRHGNVYVADSGNHCIRKISVNGSVTTIAGSKQPGMQDGGTRAAFYGPAGLAVDGAGNILVADYCNHRVRKIDKRGTVTTLAGSTCGFSDGRGSHAQMNRPSGVACDASGNVYVADSGNHRIRKITDGLVTTVAGTGVRGYHDAIGFCAMLAGPRDVVCDADGSVIVCDQGNARVRRIVIHSHEACA